jgi:hypothetical protein
MNTLYKIISILLILLIIVILAIDIRKDNFFNITNTKNESEYLEHGRVMPPWNILHEDICKKIANSIISQINKTLDVSYYFLNFENVSSYPTKTGLNIIIDFWIHDTINKITKRLIANIEIDNVNKNISVQNINLSQSMQGQELTNEEPFLKPTIDPQLVLTDDNVKSNKGQNYINGIEEIKLDYSEFIPQEMDYLFQGKKLVVNKNIPYKEFQRNILPPNIMMAEGMPLNKFPSRRTAFCWDTHGVSVSEPETSVRSGLDNSPWFHYPYPYDNPSINKQITNRDTNNLWLMSSRNTSGRGSDLTY